MAKGARKKPDEYPAQKIGKETLETLTRALILIGKPLYLLLTFCSLSLFFIAYLIGHSIRVFLSLLTKFPKVKASKIKIPQIRLPIKLLKLRLQLTLTIFSSRISKVVGLTPRLKINTKLIIILLLISSFCYLFWYEILKDLPNPKDLTAKKQDVSTKIYDRNGVLLYKIYKNKNRTPVSLGKIPLTVRLATLAAEDAEFYQHPGFSIRGILRAMVRNIKKGEIVGGSTITQQLVKNVLLTPEKTIGRKIKEIILAIEVEFAYSKDQILEMYLNSVSYGGTAYGIEEASYYFFGKDVDKLDLAEAAFLAGLPKGPTKYSPFGTNPDLGVAREKDVLRLMTINKFITKDEAQTAETEKLVFAPVRTDIKAPHFVMYVKDQLVDKYGEEIVGQGGLEVTTTLDYSIQKMAEETVKSEIEKLKNLRVGNGAALVIDPETGEILAMVGSKNYFDQEHDGNVNVTIRPRQPGSSIKIINYAYALSHGFTPATILDDSPVTYSVPGQPPYTPKDYDGEFRGKISLRSALGQSRNIPAVKTLASYGVNKMVELGKSMGITTWDDPSRFGLSLTLGGGEVKLIDLAKVYSTIANYGKRPEIVSLLKVTDFKGKVLEETHQTEGEQVIDPRVSYLLIDILKDNIARAPEFGTNSQLVIPNHPEVAVKTGTSNNLRDNLTLGFNQKYLVAVWVGNNDNSEMSHIASGITGAAPIFNSIMRHLLANAESVAWDPPEGLAHIQICALTGTLACQGCPTRSEWFLEETVPKRTCDATQVAQILEEKAKKEGQILETGASTSNP